MNEQEKGEKSNVKEFINDVRAEFKKISWPTLNELKSSTWIVIAVILTLATFVFLCDRVLFGLLRAVAVMGQ